MSERWRETYDAWKLASPYDDCNLDDEERDEWVLACGYPGCCMPGYHFRSECHNADDIEAYNAECEAERATEPQPAEPK